MRLDTGNARGYRGGGGYNTNHCYGKNVSFGTTTLEKIAGLGLNLVLRNTIILQRSSSSMVAVHKF